MNESCFSVHDGDDGGCVSLSETSGMGIVYHLEPFSAGDWSRIKTERVVIIAWTMKSFDRTAGEPADERMTH